MLLRVLFALVFLITVAAGIYFIVKKQTILGSFLLIFSVTIPIVYFYFFSKKTVEKFQFNFLHDAANVAANPEVYCGDSLLLPDEYDVYGSRFQCLKKGVGIGMGMSDAKVMEALARPPPEIGPRENVYCGNAAVLPDGYNRFGSRHRCLQKGVGAGIRMPLERRRQFQEAPFKRLSKKELMQIARRLKISTDDRTRAQTIERIRERV